MKRFYKDVGLEEVEGGWTVALDGRPIRTPAKAAFVAPARAVADAAAAEWAAQEEVIKPGLMPVTRAVNTAIDRTGPEFDAVAEAVAAYGGSDLTCYRAEAPAGLVARQAEAWDPLLDWARDRHGARLMATAGVMHVAQGADALARLRAEVDRYSPLGLTALYDLTALSGSLLIALAVAEGDRAAEEGWRLSRIDETWNEEEWGVDEGAAAQTARKRRDFLAAAHLIDLIREG